MDPSSSPSSARRGLALAGFLALTYGAAALGARFMPDAWYAALAKPAWNPPNWIFAPVWTLLYTLMAVAAWLVWRRGPGPARRRALTLYGVQLALNAAWTPLFFGLHRLDLASAEILVLWVAIVATIAAFARVSRAAAWLLAPYLAWVSFATALTVTIWRLNA